VENISFDNLFNNLKDNKSATLRDHINLIKSSWIILLLICTVVVGLAVVYSMMSTDIYVATTEIKITTPQGSILSAPVIPMASLKMENNLIANEIQTISNPTIKLQVANLLMDTIQTFQNTKEFSVLVNREDGKPVIKNRGDILKALSKNVSITQKGNLDFIEISAESPSPNEAALIANLYANVYREFNLAMNRDQLTTIKETLSEQRAEKLVDLIESENAIKNYQLKGGVIQLDAQAKNLIDKLSDFESRKNTAKIEMNIARQSLDNYKKELEQRDPSLIKYLENKSSEPYLLELQKNIAVLETNRDIAILNNPAAKNNSDVIKDYDNKISELKDKLKESIDKYQTTILASSPEEIKSLMYKVFEEEVKYQSLAASYNQLGQIMGSYEQKFNSLPTRTLDLARLERERAVFEKLYLTLEEKYQEALINEQSIPGNVIIMNSAYPPDNPSKPNRIVIIMLSLMAALALGLGFVYIRHYLDKSIKTPEDLERLKIKFLTWIPKVKGRKNFNNEKEFIMLTEPESLIGESFRALRTRIQFSKNGSNAKTILITSSAPAEGKTLISLNLAGCFAQDEKRTLIVDCDLRKPRLHSIMGESIAPGLTDYLFGKTTYENILRMSKLPKLDYIPAGTIQNNPSEILNSRKMISLLHKLKEDYDIVILDTAPILAVSDSEVLVNFVDASILVASVNSTNIDWVKQSVELLKREQNSFLGVVLNNYDFQMGYPANYKYHGYYYANEEEAKKKKSKFKRKLKLAR
jgi:capsular exopolysaccharide synthesis family protein